MENCVGKRGNSSGNGRKKRQVKFCASLTRYQAVIRVAKDMGFRLVDTDQAWNILWADGPLSPDLVRQIKPSQSVNHFPGMQELSMKRCLARNLNRMARFFPDDYDIFPRTWCLPLQLNDAQEYSRSRPSTVFILKPDHGSQGRGIRLCRNLRATSMTQEKVICQEYVKNPLLIDGYKFDMRVYVLIISMDPLKVFVYNEGLARFATNKYHQPSISNRGDIFMHLTNYSLNKNSQNFCSDKESGSKRNFTVLNKILQTSDINVQELWNKIDDVILKTILSAYTTLKHIYRATFHQHRSGCFEVLGFDILIDKKLRPLILEVNQSPSFHTNEEVDQEVKESLIRDTFRLVLSAKRKCGNFRVLWPNTEKESYTKYLDHPSTLFAATKNAQIRQEINENALNSVQKTPETKIVVKMPDCRLYNDWQPMQLDDIRSKDHNRVYSLAQRETLVKLSGIQSIVVWNFFEKNLLTWNDRIKFQPLIEKFESSDEAIDLHFLDISSAQLVKMPQLPGVRKNRTTMLRQISHTIEAN
ncbi:tubulin polyglutamylase TTLL6-like [Phlebotomus argentipes]|uniref:tubulin polyglutamylase TTLL6-like n=1 Tax=Phlebotomus argentipes TaxID=94469 RepID=UPI0028937F33|nr:tubulin polyglutamylase TTLL6-like [Phlebotomus argentipes]